MGVKLRFREQQGEFSADNEQMLTQILLASSDSFVSQESQCNINGYEYTRPIFRATSFPLLKFLKCCTFLSVMSDGQSATAKVEYRNIERWECVKTYEHYQRVLSTWCFQAQKWNSNSDK